MMELFSPPAVMRLLFRASTAVRLASDCGQRLDRTSRVTCSEAKAFRRATEIAGLFFSAIDSASFTLSLVTFDEGELATPGADCARLCVTSAPSRIANFHVMLAVLLLVQYSCVRLCPYRYRYLCLCRAPSDRPRAREKR